MKVAVLGLGIMGAGIAGRIAGAGFEISVWNRNPAKAQPLAELGARVAASPADAVRGVDLALAMLADDDASRHVWLGEDGALAALSADAIAVESSTLSRDWVAELGKHAAAAGVGFIDAPVTGSKAQAEGGTLKFIVGGDKEHLERVRPVLEAASEKITHVGPAGSGATMKLLNNFLCGVQVASLAEALAAAERLGMDVEQVRAIISDGAPGSPLVRMVGERMMAQGHEVHFPAKLMGKDLRYAAELGESVGLQFGTAESARTRFLKAVDLGLGDRDMSSVIDAVRSVKS